jgi:hypothetical protein
MKLRQFPFWNEFSYEKIGQLYFYKLSHKHGIYKHFHFDQSRLSKKLFHIRSVLETDYLRYLPLEPIHY